MYYTAKDKGCWIDGAYGQDHACAKLQLMLDTAQGDGKVSKLGQELYNNSDSEFIHEIMNDATDKLAEYTESGLIWFWEAGDLILTTEEEAEV